MKSGSVVVKASILWFVLVALTLASIEFPASVPGGHGQEVQVGMVVLLTFVKVFIIGWKFMELDHASALLKRCFLLWVIGIGGSVLFIAVN